MFNLVVSVMLVAGLAARVDGKASAATVMDNFAYTTIHTCAILYIAIYIYTYICTHTYDETLQAFNV